MQCAECKVLGQVCPSASSVTIEWVAQSYSDEVLELQGRLAVMTEDRDEYQQQLANCRESNQAVQAEKLELRRQLDRVADQLVRNQAQPRIWFSKHSERFLAELEHANEDECKLALRVVRKIVGEGREEYGPFVAKTDTRTPEQLREEALDEKADSLTYSVMAEMVEEGVVSIAIEEILKGVARLPAPYMNLRHALVLGKRVRDREHELKAAPMSVLADLQAWVDSAKGMLGAEIDSAVESLGAQMEQPRPGDVSSEAYLDILDSDLAAQMNPTQAKWWRDEK